MKWLAGLSNIVHIGFEEVPNTKLTEVRVNMFFMHFFVCCFIGGKLYIYVDFYLDADGKLLTISSSWPCGVDCKILLGLRMIEIGDLCAWIFSFVFFSLFSLLC